jgi:hypothetical protein
VPAGTPVREEPELFAAEIAMERKSSSLVPLLFIVGLVIVVGGTIYYFVKGAEEVLTVPVATTSMNEVLKAQGPATVSFQTGSVDKPLDAHYELLSKAGVLTLNSPKTAATATVTVTGAGETLLSNIDGVQKEKRLDNGTKYMVPLAVRKLVSIDKITMIRPHLAKVDYTWQWKANRLGQEFDASGELVKSFSTWDRSTLIKSYGVDFYSAEPTKTSIVLMEGDNGVWKPYRE